MPFGLSTIFKLKSHDMAHNKLTQWIGNPYLISLLISVVLVIIIVVSFDEKKNIKNVVKLFIQIYIGITIILVTHNIFIKEQLQENTHSDKNNELMEQLHNPVHTYEGSIHPRQAVNLPPVLGPQQSIMTNPIMMMHQHQPMTNPMMMQPQPQYISGGTNMLSHM